MSYGNRSHGIHGNSRPGLLGPVPGTTSRRLTSSSPQRGAMRLNRGNQGILGSCPSDYQHEDEIYERKDDYRRGGSFKNSYEDQSYQRDAQSGGRYSPQPSASSSIINRFPPKTRRLMENFGLTSSDLEELSRLPDHKLSSTNFLEIIKNMKERKQNSEQPRQSFDDHYDREPAEHLYDPFEGLESPSSYPERREEDALSSFQEKWYSESSKKDDHQMSGGSILRGSRGPMAKSNRWERDERPPPEKHSHRSPPRLMEQRHQSPSPKRRQSPMMMQRRQMSPPPMVRMSPQHRKSPPRRRSPPARMQPGPPNRGGLLGDPRDPSTQELDILAATANHPSHGSYRPPSREYNEPTIRSRTPPPLMSQIVHAKQKERMPAPRPGPKERMPAPRPGPPPRMKNRGPESNYDPTKPMSDLSFHKSHAQAEANIMRREQGRVLYLRYKAGAIGVIREEHLVKLAQPFEKVTNILLVAPPKNSKSGWFQAFVELAHFDGAAAMLEHYMTRPPSIEGITMMVQRSKHQNLQLRSDQMNRDFDHLLDSKTQPRRRRRPLSGSPDRGQRPVKAPRVKDTPFRRKLQESAAALKLAKETLRQKQLKTLNAKKKNAKRERPTDQRLDKAKDGNAKKTEKPEKAKRDIKKLEKLDKIEEDNVKKSENKVKELSAEQENKEKVQVNGQATLASKLKNEKNTERLAIIRDNLNQAITMCEEILNSIKEETTKDTLSEVTEYLTDSTDQLKEIEESLQC